MIRSMTGYGEATRDLPEGLLRVTVKTVNHRFFNAHLRTPPGFDRYEGDIHQRLKVFFSRGHVNLALAFERTRTGGGEGLPELDLERARHYRDLLHTLWEELGIPGDVELRALLRFPDLFRLPDPAGSQVDVDPELLSELVEEAAQGQIYTGSQAFELKLVDKLGAFSDAIDLAKEEAEKEEVETTESKEEPEAEGEAEQETDKLFGQKA